MRIARRTVLLGGATWALAPRGVLGAPAARPSVTVYKDPG